MHLAEDRKGNIMHYARGGRVHPMHLKAESLRQKGQRRDKILAHINPEEAEFLRQTEGMDINPYTGLPQFGLFGKKTRKWGFFGPSRHSDGRERTETFFQQGRRHNPVLGALGDIASSALGTALGGPIGGIAASAFKGGLDKGVKGIPGGVMKGVAYNAIAPSVGEFFGADPSGMFGRMAGLNSPSLLSQLGMQSAPSMGGGMGLWGNGGQQGLFQSGNSLSSLAPKIESGVEKIAHADGEKGWLGNMFGKVSDGIMNNPLDAALLGMTVAGTLGRKSKAPKEASMKEHMEMLQFPEDPSEKYRKVKASKRKYREPPVGYRPGVDPEHLYFEPEAEPEFYAHGGRVQGYSGGASDTVSTRIPKDTYIMNSTDVSLLGDGNTENGMHKLDKFVEHYSDGGFAKNYMSDHTNRKMLDVRLSDGEYKIPPEVVEKLGKGSASRGAKKIDNARKKLRKHKGVKAILPPKSKDINSYLR